MRSKPDYSDRIALCEHRKTAICDKCFQKALNDAYAIGREYGRLDENDKAAGIAEKRCSCPHHISIAYEIRSRMSVEEKK